MPVLALCVKFCPKWLEATTYAVFTAIFNSAGYISSLLGTILVIVFDVEN